MRALNEPAFSAPTATWSAVATPKKPTKAGRSRTTAPAKLPNVRQDGHTRRVHVAHRSSVPNQPARRIVLPAPVSLPEEERKPTPRKRTKQRDVASPVIQKEANFEVKIPEPTPKPGVKVEDEAASERATSAETTDELSAKDLTATIAEARGQHVRSSEGITIEKPYLESQLEQRRQQQRQRISSKDRRKPAKRTRPTTPAAASMAKTSAMKDSFQAYMQEISRKELLGQAEVIDLAAHIKMGVAVEDAQRSMEMKLGRRASVIELAEHLGINPAEVQKRCMAGTAAKNSLVAANLRLVTSIARKVAMSRTGSTITIALDDMVQEGSVGLIRAAEKFDASRGYKFSTYATWWVRAYVMRAITTQSRSIKVPSTIVDEYSRIRKEYNALREAGNFHPTDEEVAKALGITAAKLRFVVNVVTRVPASLDVSLNPNWDESNSRTFGEVVEGDDNVEERMVEDMQRKELDEALRNCLRPLERAVVRLRFGLDDGQPRTLRETGDLLGLSKERIRQLLYRALPKMKTPEIQEMLVEAATR